MNLHHQPVFHAHARHLGEHLRAEQLLLGRVGLAGNHFAEQRGRLACGKVRRLRRGVPVVGRGAAQRLEARPRLRQRVQIALPRRGIFAVLLAQLGNQSGKSRELRIDHRIGPERGNNARLPARIANRLVIGFSGSSGESVVDSTSMLNFS